MPLTQGPLFVTNSPAVARMLHTAVGLWLTKYTEAGFPSGPTPQWIHDAQAELHALGYPAETAGNHTVSEKGRPAMLTAGSSARRSTTSSARMPSTGSTSPPGRSRRTLRWAPSTPPAH